MSLTVDIAMPDTQPPVEMPPAITDMLRDEANLSIARHVLEDARSDCVTREEELKSQRPLIGFLASKKQREEQATAFAEIQGQIQAIDTMLMRVAAARERLHPNLRAALVDHFRQADPLYRQGLRAARFHEHWRRGHTVVADRLQAFIRDVRESRNAIANDIKNNRPRLSGDSAWRLGNARQAAIELEREVGTLNNTAKEHADAVAGTHFAGIRLPLLEGWDCIFRIDSLTTRLLADALVECEKILADFAEIKKPSLDTVTEIFNTAAAEHAQLAENHLRERWSELLAYAETHYVADAELEVTLVDIEKRLEKSERARLMAQFQQPFSSER